MLRFVVSCVKSSRASGREQRFGVRRGLICAAQQTIASATPLCLERQSNATNGTVSSAC